MELDEPPKNKIRKLIFKHDCLLDTNEKLKIVGQLVGRTKKICEDDVYQCMIDIHDQGCKIILATIASILKVSTRTIQRNMCEELKREKELLNQQL